MKIRTKLKIASMVPVLMAVIIGSAVIFSYFNLKEIQVVRHTVERISSNTAELNSLASEYILYHADRPKQQFMEVYDLVMRLTSTRFRNQEQQQLVDTIGSNIEAMKELFLKLASNYDLFRADENNALYRGVEERLAGQIIVKSRQVAGDVSRMERLIEAEATATETRKNILTILAILMAALPLTLMLAQMGNSIASALEALRKGTGIIASGDLHHRIGIATSDELGELSRAFDLMTDRLRDTTVSRDELSVEVEERKRAEEELRRNREWLRVTLSSIGDAVIAADGSGLVTFLNPVGAKLTGWSAEEAMGQPIQSIFRIINEETRKPAENIVERVLREGCIINLANHTALLTADGREVPIEDSAAPIRDNAGNLIGAVLVFHDVTEKRRAEEALRQSESRYRMLHESLRDAFVQVSMDGRIIECNDLYCKMLGYSPEEMGALSYHDLTPVRWHAFEEGIVRELTIPRGYSDVYEKEYRRKDGVIIPVELRTILSRDGSGHPVAMWAIVRDISERKRMEEELRKSRDELERQVRERTAELARANEELRLDEARFEALYNLSRMIEANEQEIMSVALKEQLKITRSTNGFIRLLSEDEAASAIHGWSEAVMGECRMTDHQVHLPVAQAGLWAEAIRRREAFILNDYSAPHPSKKGVPEGHASLRRLMSVPVFDGSRIVAVAVVADKEEEYTLSDARQITLLINGMWKVVQQRRSERELRSYAQRLEMLNKELEEFAFVASHDLQEPLRKIQTFCDMAVQRCAPALDNAGREYLGRVLESANRMRQLLRDLLAFSRVASRPEPFKKVKLDEAARQAADVFEAPLAETGCRLDLEDLPEIEADESQMVQLFQNLIGNALKYRGSRRPSIRVCGRIEEDGACEIRIKDNGIGFEQKYAERIFKPFQRLHGRSDYDGTGMGLAICRKIAERHGGAIRAESQPGEGSTFIVRLPAKQS